MNGGLESQSLSTSASLLRRVQNGEQQAWTRFVEKYGPLVYARCRVRGLQPDDAADVLQEVFLGIYRRLETFRCDRPGAGFRKWLNRVISNKITDHYRRLRAGEVGGGGSSAQWRIQSASAPDKGSDVSSNDADSALLTVHWAAKQVRTQVGETTWEAFWQTAVEGRNSTEVARQLQANPGAVRMAKHRVLNRLRHELDDLLQPK